MNNSNLSQTEYRNPHPLFAFDVYEHKKLKLSSIAIKIEVTFDGNVSAGTQAYALIISGKICQTVQE
jgi:hypothetical protein